jgi:hypothetical protein
MNNLASALGIQLDQAMFNAAQAHLTFVFRLTYLVKQSLFKAMIALKPNNIGFTKNTESF